MTLTRLAQLSPPWLITNTTLRDLTLQQFVRLSLPLNHVILEPRAKNTAPAIALICQILKAQGHGQDVVGIFPSDHLIEKEEKFFAALHLAEAEARAGRIVTLGIRPDWPATGYGYIQVDQKTTSQQGEFATRPVLRFHEKPDKATAESFLKDGNFFWNAGIFIFKVDAMIKAFEKHQPTLWRLMSGLKEDRSNLNQIFDQVDNISIDYAIFEKLKSDELSCIPCDIGWSDIGSWDAIAEILGDSPREAVEAESRGNFVHGSPERTYAFAGVDDLIVIDTKDALLITRRGKTQSVKDVVDLLKLKHSDVLKEHPDEERPWGRFEVLKNTPAFKSKVIQVDPGQQISYQSHERREEHWLITRGEGEVILDEKTIPVRSGSYVKIPLKSKHRIRNNGQQTLEFVEVQLGTYFGEDDIKRYQDDYDRK